MRIVSLLCVILLSATVGCSNKIELPKHDAGHAWSNFNLKIHDCSARITYLDGAEYDGWALRIDSGFLSYQREAASEVVPIDSVSAIVVNRDATAALRGGGIGLLFGAMTGYEIAGGLRSHDVQLLLNKYPAFNVFATFALGDALLGTAIGLMVGQKDHYEIGSSPERTP